jgi:catecholate siderophore receptor
VQDSSAADYKTDTSANPKFTAPLVDTPQTIQVIKEQLIRDQGATTLTEALRNTPGVGTFFLGENGNTNTGDSVFMRGFDSSSSIFVDGIRDLGSISRDVFNIEQVEVVKGPSGTDVGRTSPTGYINLVTKKPKLEDSFMGSIGFGSASYKRGSIDWNKSLSSANGIGAAFRLNAVVEDSGVAGRDFIKNKHTAIAPSIALGLNSPTRFYFDYLHVDQDNTPDGGVPTIGLPSYTNPDPTALGARRRGFLDYAAPVNPKNFYGTSSDFNNVKADMFTARVEHDFTPDLTLRNTTRYGKTKQDYMLTSFMLGGLTATGARPAPTRHSSTRRSRACHPPGRSPATRRPTRRRKTRSSSTRRT